MAGNPLAPKGVRLGGRKKGTPNKATTDFKEAVTRLLSRQSLQILFDQVPPEKQLNIIAKLAEYAFPKLGRTELTGNDGGPLVVEVVKYGGENG